MPRGASEFPLDPVLVIRENGEWTIETLEQAADFLRNHLELAPHANPEGTLRRIEAAVSEEQKRHAADAFRGWLQGTQLLVGSHWRS